MRCKLFALLISLFSCGMAGAQSLLPHRILDSLLVGKSIDSTVVSPITGRSLDELAYGLLKIDGEIRLDENPLNTFAPVVRLFCHRIDGAIATLYFVLDKGDTLIPAKLNDYYGAPQQEFSTIIRPADAPSLDNLVWKLPRQSIYYLPGLLARGNLLIVHSQVEPTFLKVGISP